MNMADLREISWSGLPVHVRSIVWQILLGYMPSNKQRRGPTLTRRRQEYYRYVNQHWADDSTLDEKAIKQIRKDVPRLCPGVPLFQHQKVRESMERVLYIFAVRFTASGYVQGIDDLCVPFYVTFLLKLLREDNCCLSIQELTVELNAAFSDTGFPRLIAPLIVSYLSASHLPPDQELKYLMDSIDPNAITEEQFENTEADSFFCMTQLIRGIQDHYIFAQPGIQKSVHKLSEIVKCIDGELHNHLLTENIQFMQFAYRWMNNLLMRELPLVLVIRVWDTYMAEQNDGGFKIFHIYTCAALIMRWAKKLKAMGFQDLVMFLQHLPTDDWTIKDIDALLSQAFVYKSLYEGARAHMQ